MTKAEARRRFDVPDNVLDRLAELEVLSPTRRGYDAGDVAIIKAISCFRAGGYDEALGFTVYDTLRYRRDALQAAPRRAAPPASRALNEQLFPAARVVGVTLDLRC